MGAKFCQRPFLHLISMVAQTVKASAYNVGDPDSLRWVRKIPWRRKWQPTPVLLTGKSHGWRSLVGCSPWGCKESDTTEQQIQFNLDCHMVFIFQFVYDPPPRVTEIKTNVNKWDLIKR